jgi:hypothetical protein
VDSMLKVLTPKDESFPANVPYMLKKQMIFRNFNRISSPFVHSVQEPSLVTDNKTSRSLLKTLPVATKET